MPEDKHIGEELSTIYAHRFKNFEIERDRIWQVLAASYFQKWVRPTDAVLDIGAGYCEFINNIEAKEKFALDVNPMTRLRAVSNVTVLLQDVCRSWPMKSETIDVAFISNFFEHLLSKEDLSYC